MEMLTTNRHRIEEVYECVKKFHTLEVLPSDLPNPQNVNLLPTLRPYQVKAVKWMLFKELYPSYYQNSHGCSSSSTATELSVLLPKGGILAEEMGLGKTVEVLACILSNPRKMDENTRNQSKPEFQDFSQQSDVESILIVQSGENCEPTADGTITVQDVVNVEPVIEDLKSGLNITNDSGCIMDYSVVESSKISPEKKELKQEEDSLTNKRKTRKRLLNSPVSIEPKRKRNNDDVPIAKKSNVDNTIDEIIVKYCYNGVPPEPKPKREAALKAKGATFAMLKAWYEDCLSETNVHSKRIKGFKQKSTVQCCCTGVVICDDVVKCSQCNTWQHTECVGYDETLDDYQYYCFCCWPYQSPVPSAGTIIISPEAISQQWVSEIEKHVKKDNLKVLVYEGVRTTGYIQPHRLASYDVIITTYEVLTKELNYTEPVKRNLRHTKRYFAPTSPLLYVQWWRLCLDEAQMVEGSSCRAAEMAKKFSAINKWAVTGTPIQKAVNDLIGLMEFLAGSECPEFLSVMSHNWRSLLMLVPRVLWRTQMKDVLAQTGVPPQTMETHFLDFSKIETYFYKCTHTECSRQFLNRIHWVKDLNIPLKSLDRKVITNLLNPLLKLRQACLHFQAVRGKFLSFKKTMTMEDLVAQMVTNAKLDCEQMMRQLVATLNGMGALHIIRKEFKEAVAAYRGVLHLEQEYKEKLKIDSLQRIHAMHNLAEVLDGDCEGIPPTLRDSTLRDDVKALELRYLDKRKAPIKVTQERVDQHADAIAAQLNGATISYSDWWVKILQWSTDREELLNKLRTAIQHTDVQQKNQYNNLANKLKSILVARAEIAVWLAEMDITREDVCKWVHELQNSDRDDMADEALRCHLPQAASIKGRTRCKLCQAESVLKKYEALLFEERSKEKRKNKKRNLPGSSDWTEDKDLDNKEIADLIDVNVNTFESSKKGGFKASPIEKMLRALAAYGRQKQAPSTWTREANNHFILIDRLKKEFLDLNLMWRHIFDLVDANDELNMCKIRLRLPYAGEDEALPGKKKKIGENHHIISLYRVEPELQKLEAEKEQFNAWLKKKIGTLCYLENLQKEGSPAAICPICRNDLTDKWSVLKCGHCVCLECLSLIRKPLALAVPCPQCRQNCNLVDVSYVESKPTKNRLNEIKGSHSTKVEAVVIQTLKLVQQQPDVKILVFSTWEKILDLLSEAYNENNITFRRLKSGKLRKRQAIKEFKTEDITVLLLPLRSGAKGLNLVEATHIFLVEPILNPAEELQAIGRVHRIGQTRPTVVHRFIVRETIEERILSAVSASGAEDWSDDCITLQQLFQLFSFDIEQLTTPPPAAGPSFFTFDTEGRRVLTFQFGEESDSDSDF